MSSVPTSRPVHPCVTSLTKSGPRGVETAAWAYWRQPRSGGPPDLITASGSTLQVYQVQPTTSTSTASLQLVWKDTIHFCGEILQIIVLSSPDANVTDSLLLVIKKSPPQWTVISYTPWSPGATAHGLQTDVLVDWSMLPHETVSIESDPVVASCTTRPGHVEVVGTVGTRCVGVSFAFKHGHWQASQPTVIHNGYVVDVCFLTGTRESVVCLLQSDLSDSWSVLAISIQLEIGRTAVIWAINVADDALQLLAHAQAWTCSVIGVNCITRIANGRIQATTAVNGWARNAQVNYKYPLAMSLDGSQWTWLSDRVAMVVLRQGQVYLWQAVERNTSIGDEPVTDWALWPTGQTLGSIGSISTLLSLPVSSSKDKTWYPLVKAGLIKEQSKLSFGLVLAGSRLGDSILMMYALELTSIVNFGKDKSIDPVKSECNLPRPEISDEYERMLQEEEDALYDISGDVVSASSEDDDSGGYNQSLYGRPSKRPKQSEHTVLRALLPIDVLTNLGPLGPETEGPIAPSPDLSDLVDSSNANWMNTQQPRLGATAHVYPCGFGSSGGLALMTVPGRDDRCILAEEDCLNVDAIFSLPLNGLILLSMSGKGVRVMRPRASTDGGPVDAFEEVDAGEWCSDENVEGDVSCAYDVFCCKLLTAVEWDDGKFSLLISMAGESALIYQLVTMEAMDDALKIAAQFTIDSDGSDLVRVTPPIIHSTDDGNDTFSLVCLWSSGSATLIKCTPVEVIHKAFFLDDTEIKDEMEVEDELQEDREIRLFYQSKRIVSVDLFKAPSTLFDNSNSSSNNNNHSAEALISTSEEVGNNAAVNIVRSDSFDEDDAELYGTRSNITQPTYMMLNDDLDSQGTGDDAVYMAICRQNGTLEIYHTDSLAECDNTPRWATRGINSGDNILHFCSSSTTATAAVTVKQSRTSKICAQELCVFTCGASKGKLFGSLALCLATVTSDGDLRLYKCEKSHNQQHPVYFERIPAHILTRASQEQTRHRTKLTRRGIVSNTKSGAQDVFSPNKLHRFTDITGQDGLFATLPCPVWVVAEKGKPTWLHHRTRHAAPVGGKTQPITGFCSSIQLGAGTTVGSAGFMTLHERVGRVGSQRLTLFSGLTHPSSSLSFPPTGILPGGGIRAEKICLGVTVRRIQFIDDPEISTANHPLYAVLVSRELETDQSELNDDGLTDEERRLAKEEKEAERIKRQVEADLGGFDVESEWVEEIHREDAFLVDTKLGGAPPLLRQQYSLWIVDSGQNWAVVDTMDLEEDEHGLTLQVMPLSDFPQEPSSSSEEDLDMDLDSQTYIAVGTGVVDHNGEDVTSRGRALLFDVKRVASANRLIASQVAELSLVYVKEIFHGPVTSLTCVSTEGRHRLVIGAGADGMYTWFSGVSVFVAVAVAVAVVVVVVADAFFFLLPCRPSYSLMHARSHPNIHHIKCFTFTVNVEQWGNGKLTQVGFYRATMQILDIKYFKHFLLLSDAYDSLYFLIWRESDKSLTLLAKDYDPIPVVATGIMRRGPNATFLCHDDRHNLQFFQYSPGEALARGGNRLICRADYHLGTRTIGMSSMYCRSSLVAHSATLPSTLSALKQQDPFWGRLDDDQRTNVYFGTTDGTIVTTIPLSEPVYWRLTALQSVMANAWPSPGGLNVRAWRLYRRCPRRGGCRSHDRKKGVIDGDLIQEFIDMSVTEQEDLASAIGSTVSLVLDNLLELQCGSAIL
jgi:CPSF A subunit region